MASPTPAEPPPARTPLPLVMFVCWCASTMAEPPFWVALLIFEPLMCASVVSSTWLTTGLRAMPTPRAPAPLTATSLIVSLVEATTARPWIPAELAAPSASSCQSGIEIGLAVRASAETVEFSMRARVLLVSSSTTTLPPTAAAPSDTATTPAKAWIVLLSVASTSALPSAVTVASLKYASVAPPIMLTAAEPANVAWPEPPLPAASNLCRCCGLTGLRPSRRRPWP